VVSNDYSGKRYCSLIASIHHYQILELPVSIFTKKKLTLIKQYEQQTTRSSGDARMPFDALLPVVKKCGVVHFSSNGASNGLHVELSQHLLSFVLFVTRTVLSR